MFTPEKVTLTTRLAPQECRDRIRSTTAAWPALAGSCKVRGFVGVRRFYLGRAGCARALLRTWIAGELEGEKASTRVVLLVGPNPLMLALLVLVFALLFVAAVAATALALLTPDEPFRAVAMCWTLVASFALVFFVVPAHDHARERAFLLAHVETTLSAQPSGASPSRRSWTPPR